MPEQPVITTKKSLLNRELTDQVATVIYNFFGVLIFITVILIASLSWITILKPKFKAINSGEEFIRKTEEYQSQSRYYAMLNSIKDSYQKISAEDKKKIESFVNVSDNVLDLYSEIEYLARINNWSADKIDNKPMDDVLFRSNLSASTKRNSLLEKTKVWRTTLTLVGDKSKDPKVNYSNLKRLVLAMESNLRLMDIQRIAFDPVANSATIEVLTYTRK